MILLTADRELPVTKQTKGDKKEISKEVKSGTVVMMKYTKIQLTSTLKVLTLHHPPTII